MFEKVLDHIENGEYYSAILEHRANLVYYRALLATLQSVDENSELELFERNGFRIIDKKLCKHQFETSEKLYNVLIKTYQITDTTEISAIVKDVNDMGQSKFTNVFDAERDKKVIKKIKEFDREFLNAEGWHYTEKMSNKFKILVNECRTLDAKYISQLSELLQAIEDEVARILLVGESGVGKSKLAKIIHSISNRSDKGFAEVNCGEYSSEDRLNQKLFGWEKGSHSTATKKNEGLIKTVDGGILFLDEIDRMPKGTRDALITFIDTKNFQRLGSDKYTYADVHFLFGTNKDLRKLVADGQFEEDFYYRISEYVITIPPLREREADIGLIIEYCLANYNKKFSTDILIGAEARSLLRSYPWYGNFRILESYLNRLFQKCKYKLERYVTAELINTSPPVKSLNSNYNDFQNFEKILLNYIRNFYYTDKSFVDVKKYKNFLDAFLSPILAKIYIEDMEDFPEKNTKAMKYVGISGEAVANSKLHKMYKLYPLLVKALFNKE